MIWVFAVVGLAAIVIIGLVVVGRETARLAGSARPAVFDLAEAVHFIADRLPADIQARISHEDVRWVLLADADLLEQATGDANIRRGIRSRGVPDDVVHGERPDGSGGGSGDAGASDDVEPDEGRGPQVVDEDVAIARIIEAADATGRELVDRDIVAVLDGRMAYLEAIGAVGPQATEPAPPA